MKKNFLSSIICFIVLFAVQFTYCQVPKKFNYQAICRNASGNILKYHSVNIQARYRIGSPSGSIYYKEIFQKTTNQFGLFTLQLGTAPLDSGSFSAVPFASQDVYLEIGIDTTGGLNFTTMGTTQFIAVPYAIVADTALHVPASSSGSIQTDNTLSGSGTSVNPLKLAQQGATNGQVLQWNGSAWIPATSSGGTSYTAGTGININGSNQITNTAPDQTVVLNNGTGISVTGNYPDFTISSTGNTTYTAGSGINITGTTISNNVQINSTLTGNGTASNPLGIAQQGATNGQVLQWNGSTWIPATSSGGTNYTAGTGISINGSNQIVNTAPDQTVALSNGTGISVTGNYPNFTINNTAADKTVSLTQGSGITITGAYPNFTIASAGSSGWSLTGNAGTNSTTNFIGTTDAQDLTFKVNNVQSGLIDQTNYNTFYGYLTGSKNVAQDNTFFGFGAGALDSSGSNNTAIGDQALYRNTTGIQNTSVGGYNLTLNADGWMNTAVGFGSMNNGTSIYYNTAVGANALNGNLTGDYNTALGCNAFSSGTYYNSMGLGANVAITASEQVRIGDANITSIGGQVGWTTLSDARVKMNVSENVPGLTFIEKLRPVTYNYDRNKENEILGVKETGDWEGKDALDKMQFSGFLAQEVEVAAKKAGYNFSGVDKTGSLWGLRYDEFVPSLVKGMQEQQAMIEELQKEVELLKQQIQQLQK